MQPKDYVERGTIPPNMGSAGRKDPDRIIIEHSGISPQQGERIIALLESIDAKLGRLLAGVVERDPFRMGPR